VEGAPAELVAALGGDVVVLGFDGGADAAARAAAALAAQDGVRHVRADGARVRVTVRDGPRRLPALLEATRGCGVSEVELQRPGLAHVFLHHTGHAFEPGAAP
jgi:hypothetical protein